MSKRLSVIGAVPIGTTIGKPTLYDRKRALGGKLAVGKTYMAVAKATDKRVLVQIGKEGHLLTRSENCTATFSTRVSKKAYKVILKLGGSS